MYHTNVDLWGIIEMWEKLSRYIVYSLLFIGSCSDSEYHINSNNDAVVITEEIPVEPFNIAETIYYGVPDIKITPIDGELGSLDVLLAETFEQEYTIYNEGSAKLNITSISLEIGDGMFSLTDSDPKTIKVNKTGKFSLSFHPDSSGVKEDYILVESNDPDEALIRIPLSGEGLAPQIEVDPIYYDFGSPLAGCPEELEVYIRNIGTTNLEVSKATYSSTLDFSFVIDPLIYGTEPWSIAPGGEILGNTTYEAYDEIYDISYLTVESNDPLEPVVVASHDGDAQRHGTMVDSFIQTNIEKVDILFVIDNSCSMSGEQVDLAANASTFITTLDASGADYRLAVITTDDPVFRGPVLSPSFGPTLISEFETQVVAGISGSGLEKGLEMAYESTLPGGDAEPGGIFQRPEAVLSIVFVSDEDDWSANDVATFYVPHFEGLKNSANKLFLHGVVGLPGRVLSCGILSQRYIDAVNLTGGVSSSICTATWAPDLEDLADGSMVANVDFSLSEIPIEETIEVFVDGVAVYTGWSYNIDSNMLVFDLQAGPPEEGELVEIVYGYFGVCP